MASEMKKTAIDYLKTSLAEETHKVSALQEEGAQIFNKLKAMQAAITRSRANITHINEIAPEVGEHSFFGMEMPNFYKLGYVTGVATASKDDYLLALCTQLKEMMYYRAELASGVARQYGDLVTALGQATALEIQICGVRKRPNNLRHFVPSVDFIPPMTSRLLSNITLACYYDALAKDTFKDGYEDGIYDAKADKVTDLDPILWQWHNGIDGTAPL